MEKDKTLKLFNDRIDAAFKLVKINHVIFTSNELIIKNRDFKYVDSYLAKKATNKITVNSAMFLNSFKDKIQQDQISENLELQNLVYKTTSFLKETFQEYCKIGENKYILNELFRKTVVKLDAEISTMNFISWSIDKNPNNNDNVLFLLLNKERRSYRKYSLDFESYCRPFFEDQFTFRRIMLGCIKTALVDIFSKHLLLPWMDSLPKIKTSCSKTEISELILALSHETRIGEKEELKSILMGMFDISKEEYNNAIYYIRDRENGKSKFMKKLSDYVDKLKVRKA